MSKPFYIADAFTTVRFDGNRAGVVLDAQGLDAAMMLAIAKEVNASETAFVLPDDEADLHLRFFTPAVEVPFCGHAFVGSLATLALAKHLEIAGEFRSLKVRTGAGLHDAEVRRGDGFAEVTMRQAEPVFRHNHHPADAILSAIGLEFEALDGALQPGLGYTGLWHLFVPVRSPEQVKSARPDFGKLFELNREAGVHTTHLFAPKARGYYCRGFAPAAGVDEDPYTGSAAGALVAFLVGNGAILPGAQVELEQRDATGRGGVAVVAVGGTRLAPSGVKVTGRAVLSMAGEVFVGV